MHKTIITLLFVLSTSMASGYEIKNEMLEFRYTPNEDVASDCTHEVLNDAHDWLVKCPYYSRVKEFVVHLLVRKYKGSQKPQDKYEVLYWITNRIPGAKVPEFTGTTLGFNFEDETVPHSIKLGQQVDNGFAHLDIKIDLLRVVGE